jgi:hypothetical protein
MHYFLDARRALSDCRRAVGMAHVQLLKSESSRSDPQFTSEGLVPASNRACARDQPTHRQAIRRGEVKMHQHFDPGSGEQSDAKCTTISIPGAQRMTGREPAVAVGDQWGRKSRCKPFEAAIDWKTEAGLSAQRIYQDLGDGDFRPCARSKRLSERPRASPIRQTDCCVLLRVRADV